MAAGSTNADHPVYVYSALSNSAFRPGGRQHWTNSPGARPETGRLHL